MQVDLHANDRELIIALNSGSHTAFKSIYDLYACRLLQYAKRFLKSYVLAEEVVQDVFIKLWDNRTNVSGDLVGPYLFTICKNHILNTLKKVSREVSLQQSIEDSYFLQNHTPDNEIIFNEFQKLTEEAIAKLPPQRQKIFTMCRLEGRSYEEVSTMLQISKGTINDHIIKSNRFIREYLSVQGDLIIPVIIIQLFFSM
jgi:RNA polymerase sigma-70 factor (family 1)